jgi:hypothetical protein
MSCYWKYALLFVSLLRTLLGGTDLIDLSSFVSGSDQGVRLIGASDGTHSGNSVAIIGDFDADGTKDFVIGAPQMGNKGAAFIILGAAHTTEIDTSYLTSGSDGMKIVGANFGDQLGYSVGAAGDVNDDGYDDCMCGAPGAGTLLKPNAGTVYMIFGNGLARRSSRRRCGLSRWSSCWFGNTWGCNCWLERGATRRQDG